MENWKAVIFLAAAAQGFILSLALLVRGVKHQREGLFLGLILFVLALELLNAWAMQVHYHHAPDAFPFWNFQSYLQLPISLWFFVQLTTTPNYSLKQRYWLVYLPVFFEILIRSSWQLYRRFVDQRVPSLLDQPVWFFLTEILPIIGMIAVLWIYARKLIQVQLSWKKYALSPTSGQYLRCYGIFSFLGILTLLWACGVLLKWPVFEEVELLLTGTLFVFGYLGYIDPAFFTLPLFPKAATGMADKPEFALYNDEEELHRLRAAFELDALHRQSKLSVDEVATHLKLPPRYISYLINTRCASNFNTFVNQYRVEEVIQKLGDSKQQHKTILALALEAGFNSKSTFNQVFKLHTGQSPSYFLKSTKPPFASTSLP